MSGLMKKENFDIDTIDNNLYSALKNSVYPGAKDESVSMVLSYCKARGLDPLQKPVHIVPMWIVDAKTKQGTQRDVVMPGIGLYRIQAQRSGQYAGQTDPEFGEDISEMLDGVTITFPKWCKVTVKKQMPNGEIVDFSAKEFWKENYATAKKDSTAPNSMWKKRPYAQLAKCAEAQALRKAFPDIIDQSPSAEEMEGKTLNAEFEEIKPISPGIADLNKQLGLSKPEYDMSSLCKEINEAQTLNDLEASFKRSYRTVQENESHINVLTELKDKRKNELQVEIDKFVEDMN